MITTNNGDVGDDDFVNSHNNNEKAVYSALYLFCTYEESDLFSHPLCSLLGIGSGSKRHLSMIA